MSSVVDRALRVLIRSLIQEVRRARSAGLPALSGRYQKIGSYPVSLYDVAEFLVSKQGSSSDTAENIFSALFPGRTYDERFGAALRAQAAKKDSIIGVKGDVFSVNRANYAKSIGS